MRECVLHAVVMRIGPALNCQMVQIVVTVVAFESHLLRFRFSSPIQHFETGRKDLLQNRPKLCERDAFEH